MHYNMIRVPDLFMKSIPVDILTLSKAAELFSEIASSHVTLFVVDT